VSKKPITGIAPCCARATSGHATAPLPSSVMNSRRFTSNFSRASRRKIAPRETYCTAGFPRSLCPLWVNCDQGGRSQKLVHVRFTSKSGQTGRHLAMSALCQKRTHALHKNGALLLVSASSHEAKPRSVNHLAGSDLQRKWYGKRVLNASFHLRRGA